MRLSNLLLVLAFTFQTQLYSQVSGIVSDENGDPLPFATVYVDGTSNGTTSNNEGFYEIKVGAGPHNLIFRFVGYKEQSIAVDYKNQPIILNVTLEESVYTLGQIVVGPEDEDPAYEIIRKAIAKRKYYKDLISQFSCDTYMKGQVKLANVPEKVLGFEVGDLDGSLDSNRQGIVYLSESESELHIQKPDNVKEVMISSKVSGSDQGFSFNRASEMEFDLYQSTTKMNRSILSPIADGAFGYYRYKFVGTSLDDEGRIINNIQVIPKRPTDPVYTGNIYIVENLWLIKEASLYLLGNNMGIPLLDSLHFNQVYINLGKPDFWKVFSQSIYYEMGFMGVSFDAHFAGVFSNYDISPSFTEGFFSNEVLEVTPGSNKKDSIYWLENRPIPLTAEQSRDYIKKDSVVAVRSTKSYMDSVDRVENKLKPLEIITGYTYNNSFKKFSISYSPLSAIGFNSIQGLYTNINFSINKRLEDEENYKYKNWSLTPKINYGFSEEKLRFKLSGRIKFEEIHETRLNIELGQSLESINPGFTLSDFDNTIYTLFQKENYKKYYEGTRFGATFQRRLSPSIGSLFGIRYEGRKALTNNTNYSFYDKEDVFTSNNPLLPLDDRPAFESHEVLRMRLGFAFTPNVKYISYPGRRFYISSKWPTLRLNLQHTIALDDFDISYSSVIASVRKRGVAVGLAGDFMYQLRYQKFFNVDNMSIVDYYYFNGHSNKWGTNTSQPYVFKKLNFYEAFSLDENFQAHYQHNFRGYVMDKIPLLRKLTSNLIVGANFLTSENIESYNELSVGLGNLGFGFLKILRIDYVWSFKDGKSARNGLFFSLSL